LLGGICLATLIATRPAGRRLISSMLAGIGGQAQAAGQAVDTDASSRARGA
jgi:hypothetical protein